MDKKYVERRDHGYWLIGTRVSLDSIVSAFLMGLSPETIATDCFPTLTLEQVYGAITYYLGNRAEIDASLKVDDKTYVGLRKLTHQADRPFIDRLAKARRQLQVA